MPYVEVITIIGTFAAVVFIRLIEFHTQLWVDLTAEFVWNAKTANQNERLFGGRLHKKRLGFANAAVPNRFYCTHESTRFCFIKTHIQHIVCSTLPAKNVVARGQRQRFQMHWLLCKKEMRVF